MEKQGKKAKIPNCIMLIDEHDEISKDLIDWTGENSKCNFVKLASEDNEALQRGLWEELKKAKETFDSTKKRTLIHVDGFDRLINPETNAFKQIEWLKDIMCKTATDFGSTIIFNTKDASKLNKEVIQPHRVAAKIMVPLGREAFDLYNKDKESHELTKNQSMRPKYSTQVTVFKKEDFQQKNLDTIKKTPERKEEPQVEPKSSNSESPNL